MAHSPKFARRIDALENPMSERDIEQLDGSAGPAQHIDTSEKHLQSWCDDGRRCDDFDWNGSDEV